MLQQSSSFTQSRSTSNNHKSIIHKPQLEHPIQMKVFQQRKRTKCQNSNIFSNILTINETPKSSKISSIFNPEKILNSVVKLKASFYTFFATCIQNFKVSETLKSSTTKTSTPCSYVPN